MKRILFVIDTLGSGGGQKSLVNFLNELDPEVHDLQVDLLLFARRGIFLNQVPNYVELIETPREIVCMFESLGSLSFWRNLCPKGLYGKFKRLATRRVWRRERPELNDMQLFWELWRPLMPDLPGEYDIAIGGLEGTCSYYVMDKVRASRKVLWFHSNYSDHGYEAGWDRPYFESADKVVTISDTCLESLQRAFPGFGDKFCVLGNITSRALVRKRAKEAVTDARVEGKLNLLTVGRLVPSKGYDILLEAAKRIDAAKLSGGFVWRIIGDGPQRSEIERHINANNLVGKVELLGLRENPYPYIAACDILVQTSRYEGKSIVLDETKALCRPIVVTDYPTAKDSITSGENGIICEMDGDGVADAVLHLVDSDGLRACLTVTLESDETPLGSTLDDYLAVYLGDQND